VSDHPQLGEHRPGRLARLLDLSPKGDERLGLLAEAAQYCQEQGMLPEAKALFQAVAALAVNDPLGPLGLAEVCLARGRHTNAMRHLESALDAPRCDRPTMALCYLRLAEAHARLEHGKEAEAAAHHAAELDPLANSTEELV
jgi:predicted Zn-dependent protease